MSRKRSPWLVAGGVLVAVVLVGAGGFWLWWSNVIRGPLGAAEVVPASADIVITFDALELVEGDRVNRLVKAFDPNGGFDLGDLLAEADDAIEADTGLRPLEEARTWVGRSAAVAVWAHTDFLTASETEPDITISVMTRNEAAAADWLDDVVAAATDDGAEVSTMTLAGVDVTSLVDPGGSPVLVTVHSGRMLFSNSERRMREMIDATEPISDLSAFRRLFDAADGNDALGSVYLSADFLESIVGMAQEFGDSRFGSFPTGAVLATVTLDDDGVEFVGASIALDGAVDTEPGTWGRELPSGVYGYVSVGLPVEEEDLEALFDEQVQNLRDLGIGADMDDFLAGFQAQFGVSLRELLTLFTDQVLFAAVQSDFGALPALSGGPLGLGFGIGVADDRVFADALARLPEVLGPDGAVIEQLGDAIWAVDPGGGEIARYGVVDGRLVIASDQDTFNAVLGASGGGVEEDPEWRRLAGLVGDDMVVYVDIARIIGTFASEADAEQLAPLRSFGAAATTRDGVSVVTARLVIDY